MADTEYFLILGTVPGGNGTEKRQDGPNRAFSNLDEFETTVQGVYGPGDRAICTCIGAPGLSDTSAPTFDGWSGGGQVVIRADVGQEAVTPIDTSRYFISCAFGGSYNLQNEEQDVTVIFEDICFCTEIAQMGDVHFYGAYGGGISEFHRCVFATDFTSQWSTNRIYYAVNHWAGRDPTATLENCLFYNICNTGGTSYAVEATNGTVRNCGVIASGSDVENLVAFSGAWTGDIEVVNSYVRNNTVAAFGSVSGGDYNSSSVSGDAFVQAPRDNTLSPWYSGGTSDSAIFSDATNDDFHLVSDSTIFESVGDNLYSLFQNDLDNQSRSDGSFTLGPLIYVSSGTVYNETLSLNSQTSISVDNVALLDSTASLSQQLGLTLVGNLDAQDAFLLAVQFSQTNTESLNINVALTIAQQLGLSTDSVIGSGAIEAAISLGMQTGLTLDAAQELTVGLILASQLGYSLSNTADLRAALNYTKQLSMSMMGGFVYPVTLSFDTSFDLTTDSFFSLEDALSFAFESSLDCTVQVDLAAALVLANEIGLTTSSQSDLTGFLTLKLNSAINTVATMIMQSGMTLDCIVDISLQGSILQLTLQTPDSRTVVVEIETRTVLVPEETRTVEVPK